jgi:hypothetical protein
MAHSFVGGGNWDYGESLVTELFSDSLHNVSFHKIMRGRTDEGMAEADPEIAWPKIKVEKFAWFFRLNWAVISPYICEDGSLSHRLAWLGCIIVR